MATPGAPLALTVAGTNSNGKSSNGQIFEEATGKIRENPVLKELADLTGTLEMEDADQADANTLNYVLERWVIAQGRLSCCK